MGCRLGYFEKSEGFRGLGTLASRVPESKPLFMWRCGWEASLIEARGGRRLVSG